MDNKEKYLPTIPPLSVANLEALEVYENRLRVTLGNCMALSSLVFNEPKARAYLRSYIVEIFDFYYSCYKNFPAYNPMWINRIVVDVIVRVIICYLTQLPGQSHTEQKYSEEMADVLWRHVKALQINTEEKSDTNSGSPDRATLVAAYQTKFPGASILDICWAAEQTRREWTRWLKGEHKDGSKPDRSFRSVLLSQKSPKTLRPERRPKGWR